MSTLCFLMFAMSLSLAIVSLIYLLLLKLEHKKLCNTVGTIIEIHEYLPKKVDKKPSLATLMYTVDGQLVTSKNKVLVSADYMVGDRLACQYYTKSPNTIYQRSERFAYIIIVLSLLTCFLAFALQILQ